MCTLKEESRVLGTLGERTHRAGAFGERAQGLKWIYTSTLWLLDALHLGLLGRVHWQEECMCVLGGGGAISLPIPASWVQK